MPQSHSRPQPSLLPIERPRCPWVREPYEPEPDTTPISGYDLRNFECAMRLLYCRDRSTDPMKSDKAGWIVGELKPPE
jgi:hypothetical protein